MSQLENREIHKKTDGTKVVAPEGKSGKKFKSLINITDEKVKLAQKSLDRNRDAYAKEIVEKLDEAQRLFDVLKKDVTDETTKTELARIILDTKSNAGMYGMGVVSDVSTLFFNLFDENYPFDDPKVIESVELYFSTIVSIVKGRLDINSDDEKSLMIAKFKQLNEDIRP